VQDYPEGKEDLNSLFTFFYFYLTWVAFGNIISFGTVVFALKGTFELLPKNKAGS
jgi:hypothetical protein